MAQWLGKYSKPFTGRTHGERVQHFERVLRKAVGALRLAAGSDTITAKAKAVRHLADRLYAARLREVRARLATEAPAAPGKQQPPTDFHALRTREQAIKAKGVPGILAEFDAPSMLE